MINRCLIGPFIMHRTCLQVSGPRKLLPTLQVLDWQIYYSSPNGLQKILYEKMIYFPKEFNCALIYPECSRGLPGPSSSVHKGGLLKARIAGRVRSRRTQKSTSRCGHFTDGSAEAGADRAESCRHFPSRQRYFPLFF